VTHRPFQSLSANVVGNDQLRRPQVEGYIAIREHFSDEGAEREIAEILPVGCGKSGLITIAPFAVNARRALVIAPNLGIAEQLMSDFDPASANNFYLKAAVLPGPDFPDPADARGKQTNRSDLEAADVVITNIQQLEGGEANRHLGGLSIDFFDLILLDEGHHNVAVTWDDLRQRFPGAKVISFSATPLRADGQRMRGRIIYQYAVADAINDGYVKRIKAIVLNPATLKYVRHEDGRETEVGIEEIRRLGEADSKFRRGIVMSDESLTTIVDAAIGELERIREATGDKRHKIIASALEYEHCAQVTRAFRERGLRTEFVHANEGGKRNADILARLDRDELDVIVQVRMLGEGFDHPWLSVAAVCSVFSNLSPFVQFVGRIMRVIPGQPKHGVANRGTVIYHAGSNIARRWSDFREFSAADQRLFDELLPEESREVDPSAPPLTIEPAQRGGENVSAADVPRIAEQGEVRLEEQVLVGDPELDRALATIESRALSGEDVEAALVLRKIPVTSQRARQASRAELHERTTARAAAELRKRHLNPMGHELDTRHLGKSNLVVVASAISVACNERTGHEVNERHEFTQDELTVLRERFEEIVGDAVARVFGG
jgi:superfamily II DNA or RNA helicase